MLAVSHSLLRPHDEIDKRINYLEEKFGNCITLVDEQSRIKSSIEITGLFIDYSHLNGAVNCVHNVRHSAALKVPSIIDKQ